MTDFRALCAELHAAFNTYAVDEAHHDLLVRTEAALAQPEPQGPTDEELDLVVIAIQALIPHQPDVTTHDLDAIDRGREILKKCLARWGRPAIEPQGPTDEEILRIAAKTIEPYETHGIAVGEYEAETNCAVETYGSELIAFARAVLDRWGGSQSNAQNQGVSQ